jgi:hypothetical protein
VDGQFLEFSLCLEHLFWFLLLSLLPFLQQKFLSLGHMLVSRYET